MTPAQSNGYRAGRHRAASAWAPAKAARDRSMEMPFRRRPFAAPVENAGPEERWRDSAHAASMGTADSSTSERSAESPARARSASHPSVARSRGSPRCTRPRPRSGARAGFFSQKLARSSAGRRAARRRGFENTGVTRRKLRPGTATGIPSVRASQRHVSSSSVTSLL